MSNFQSLDGDIDRLYITEYELIDRFLQNESLWSFGSSQNFGQLGDNTVVSKSSPVQTVAGGTNWKQISTGYFHSAGIKSDGTLWTWGHNQYGQLGDNTIVSKSSPVQTVAGGTNWKRVSCGINTTAGIKTDGTLWIWGLGASGQLGDNSIVSKSSPVQTVAGDINWKQVACGYYHTAAIKTDGTLWLWGDATSSQLGDNSIVGKSSPVQTVAGGTNWKQVSCGVIHTIALKKDNSLWGFGRNLEGQLGDNTVAYRASPVQTITGGTNWKQVSCGGYFTSAIKTDSTLWVFGDNTFGQLGDNTVVFKSSPVQTVAGGTNWKLSTNGYQHISVIKTDGTLWVCGYNSSGQLGDNTVVSKSSPVQTVAGGTNWKSIAAGGHHTLALKI